jgi:hypothetical protein
MFPAPDGHIVYESAVAATQIGNNEAVAISFDDRVPARNRSTPDLQGRPGLAADKDRPVIHRDNRIFELTGNGGNSGLHHVSTVFSAVRGVQVYAPAAPLARIFANHYCVIALSK